jgi:hypothetical protein
VEAAFIQPWSTGPVEGHVHKIKLLKRAAYVEPAYPNCPLAFWRRNQCAAGQVGTDRNWNSITGFAEEPSSGTKVVLLSAMPPSRPGWAGLPLYPGTTGAGGLGCGAGPRLQGVPTRGSR